MQWLIKMWFHVMCRLQRHIIGNYVMRNSDVTTNGLLFLKLSRGPEYFPPLGFG